MTENDPQMGSALWQVRYVYDALGRRIQRDYDEFVWHETPDGSFELPHKDTRWYDYDGDTLIGESQIDRRFVFRPTAVAAPLPVPGAGDDSLGLPAQQFEHSPFAARSDLADLGEWSGVAFRGVRGGPFADPFAVVSNTNGLFGLGGGSESLGDALLRYSALALVQQGGFVGSYTSYTGSDLVEINGGGNYARFGPSGEITQLYDYNGRLVWDEVTADRRIDAWNNENNANAGVPPPSFPFTTAGGYRDDATGYISDPNGGMNGAYDPAIGEDAEDDLFTADGHNPLYDGVTAKRKQLMGYLGETAEQAIAMHPVVSAYTALTGKDAMGNCVGIGGRIMAGASVVPVAGIAAKAIGKLGKVLGKVAGLLRRAPVEEIAEGLGDVERVRHHTDLKGLRDIKRDIQINPNFRSETPGVDVEGLTNGAFGPTTPGAHNGPKGRFGSSEGAYVEFDRPSSSDFKIDDHSLRVTGGEWTSLHIQTSDPLSIYNLNPKYVKTAPPWWKRIGF